MTNQITNKELIEILLKIRNKRGEQVRFKLNKAQQYYWERKTRRNLILKARQKGLTKIIDADQLIDCVSKSTNAVVISHEAEATKRLFAAVKYYIDNLEIKPYLNIDSKREMKFPKTGSTYFIGTAGQRAFGRGDTIDRAHLSEASFYPDLEKTLAGIAEAAEYGQIDIETTPNGRDYFYDMWQKAKTGDSAYTPIFIPWFIDGEYSADSLTDKERDGLSQSVRDMFNTPDAEFKAGYTKEEKELIERVAKEYKINLKPGQIKWRRYKIWDKGDIFFQEYPEDDESCFLQSGRAVFSKITTKPQNKIPLDNIMIWGDRYKRTALRKRTLYAGIDGAVGTPDGDAHVFSVINAPVDKNATVIYEYHSNEPIDVFWDKIERILKKYNIRLAIEDNGIGGAHIQEAKRRGIPHIKWTTNGSNRPIMISDLEEAYRKEELIETYTEAEGEARNMTYSKKTNRAEHQNGKHDDRVFSRAIAWAIHNKPRAGVTML